MFGNQIVILNCMFLSLYIILNQVVYSMFYMLDGLFFNGISIALVGLIMFVYLIVEFIFNLLFNREHAINHIFVIFILSIFLKGFCIIISYRILLLNAPTYLFCGISISGESTKRNAHLPTALTI